MQMAAAAQPIPQAPVHDVEVILTFAVRVDVNGVSIGDIAEIRQASARRSA